MANITQCFSINYKHYILDEISLDGLEGIGIELLWRRMEKRMTSTITPKMKTRFWNFIIANESISIYHISEPHPHMEILDRFTIIDEATGYILDPPQYLDGSYEWCPVENEYGSCSNYNSRILIAKPDIQSMTYEEVELQYGDRLVLVASLEERWHALAPHLPIININQLTIVHYGLLELIGRGRKNGQMTIGKTNLSKIVKEPKLLFYNRNVLQKLDLIEVFYTTQVTYGKAMKSILLRLKRFHQPVLESLPKIGRIANIVEYLLNQPDHSELNEVMIKKGFLTSQHSKRFQKSMNIFAFDDREVKVQKNANSKSEKQKDFVKKKFISFMQKSTDSSSSDEGNDLVPLQCQYKVGVGIMRQAYERFLEAGLKGLSQTEVAQLLGVEFYTSRTICRVFKSKNLVREFLEDKGRQRRARYIAVAATEEIDKEYTKEKNKLLEHVQNTSKETSSLIPLTADNSDSDSDIPIKKLKLEKNLSATEENIKNNITAIKVLEGFENIKESLLSSKKDLTLRQLKYANGILKVVKELKFVIGFQTLSMLVSKEIGVPPMDTKAIKLFVHKLMTDGQLKVLKVIRPNKCSYFICAPHIKPTDEIIRKKYKEMCGKSEIIGKNKKHKTSDTARPLWQFIYQRYTKIQALHEFITKFVYFDDEKSGTHFLPGFSSLLTIIPEMTAELALNNISNLGDSDIADVELDENSKILKIRDIPETFGKVLLHSKSLQNSIRSSLKDLAALGLIQLVQRSPAIIKKGDISTYIFYVNRRAKILNTSGKWPRPTNENNLEKSFYFETFEDVKKYWLDVTTISSNTIISVAKHQWFKLVYPLRNETEVNLFDTGERLGDNLGPCGFDSSIFMDIPRLWRKFVFKYPKTLHPVTSKPKIRKIIRKRNKKPTKVVKKEKPVIKVIIPVRRRNQNNPTAITWSNYEDKILMFCNVAITIMSPAAQPGTLKIRNIVAKDLLTMNDPKKTAAYCHKRSLVLDSNSVLAYEKDCIINDLRRRRSLIKKYEGLLKVLRLRHYGNISKFIHEARLPMLELIWLASQVEKIKSYIQEVPCIALNFDDFNRNYTIAATTANRRCNMYRTPTTYEPEFATLKEGIILSVMLSIKNQVTKETAQKIYSTFDVYPETTLRSAVEQLRKAGAIAPREKVMNNYLDKVHFDDIVESSYKISAGYRRKWINRLEPEFIENLANILNTEVPKNGLKGSCELNCLLCEMNSCDLLDITSDTVPVVTGSAGSIVQEEQMNMIDMETKYKLKSGLIAWKGKHNIKKFSNIYNNEKYKIIFESISKEAVVASCGTDIAYDTQDTILMYLEEKGQKGCTFIELQSHLSMDRNTLCSRLEDLESKKMIKRIGYYENLITLTKYATPMLLQIEPNFHIIPAPWLTLEAELQHDIFVRWTSVIVNKVFESPGCSVEYLSKSFECITTRSVQDICTFLVKCECVTLCCIQRTQVDLFSEDCDIPELINFTPYDTPNNILVFPVKNCLTRYACLRKDILNEFKLP